MSDVARYPIGRYQPPAFITPEVRQVWLGELAALPTRVQGAVTGLTDEQLKTPYRMGGWTLKQVVHHLPDSHLNSYVRCKWALTEDAPIIKAYFEDRWAELPDTRCSVDVSLRLLKALHSRWVVLLESLDEAAWARTFVHPETGQRISLAWNLGYYVWHGQHHTAHITALRKVYAW